MNFGHSRSLVENGCILWSQSETGAPFCIFCNNSTNLNMVITFYTPCYLHIRAAIATDFINSKYMPHIRHHKYHITPKFSQVRIPQKYTTTSKGCISNVFHNNTQNYYKMLPHGSVNQQRPHSSISTITITQPTNQATG